jgi:tRNA(fMet)-specific endonuclease VapC
MGVILDSSVLIAEERGKFDLAGFLGDHPGEQPLIATITASELLHGVERAADPVRKAKRSRYVEQLLSHIAVIPFSLGQARVHAKIWAELSSRGETIGPHDLIIAAAALTLRFPVATLNASEFRRASGLSVIDASPFRR